MSYTIVQSPQIIMPVYNPIVFTVNSSNKSQCNFNYICDIYVAGVYITRLKLFPSGTNGYASFKVNRVLEDLISFDLNNNLYGSSLFSISSNSYISYELKFGEEFDNSPQCDAGTIVYPNQISSNSIHSFEAFNGALQYKEWLSYDHNLYTPTFSAPGAFAGWLTNTPNQVMIRQGDQMVWNAFATSTNLKYLDVRTYTESNTMIGEYIFSNPTTSSVIETLSVGVGPENLNNSTLYYGAQPVITNNVHHYTVQLFNSGLQACSDTMRTITLDKRFNKWTPHRLWWLNRLGGFDSYTFTLKDSTIVNSSRNQFNKLIGDFKAGSPSNLWNYNLGDRGTTTLSVNAQESNTYTSNWLTENEALWMEELFTSPEVYLQSTNAGSCNCQGIVYSVVLGGDTGDAYYITFNVADPNLYTIGGTIFVSFGDDNPFSPYTGSYEVYGIAGHAVTVYIGTTCVEVDMSCIITGLYNICVDVWTTGFVSEMDPVVIKSGSWEEKTKNKVRNISYTIEVDKAYGKNIQRN